MRAGSSRLGAPDPFAASRYRSLGELAGGGTSVVHRVEDREDGSLAIAKLVRRELLLRADAESAAQLVDRLRFEFEALQRLNAFGHPNIVRALAFEQPAGGGPPFIVMEWLDGRTLEEEAVRRSIGAGEAVSWICQLLSALDVAHGIGIVHRDINLHNLFLHRPADGQLVLKLLDFGAAKGVSPLAPAPVTIPTREGFLVGGRRFQAPEAIHSRRFDARTDLYLSGLVLNTLLTGLNPFPELFATQDLFAAHVEREFPPPSRVAPAPIPAALDGVVLKALAKDPDARFQSAREFLLALKASAPARAHEAAPLSDELRSAIRGWSSERGR